MKEHIYSVKAKSQAGNIKVKYIMTTQKGQSQKKISKEYQESYLGNYALCWKFSTGPWVQERALLELSLIYSCV